MGHKTVSLIINARNGANTAKLQAMLAIFSAAGWRTRVLLKEYGKHVMKLAYQAASEKKNLVIAYGGDGTLNQVVNGVMSAHGKRSSVVGLLPGGTANVWAGEIGVPFDPVKAALTLVNSEARKVDVGRFAIRAMAFPGEDETPVDMKAYVSKKAMQKQGKLRKARHHFLLMAGMGIDAAIMSGVSRPLKYQIGPFAVGLSAARELPIQRSFFVELYDQGQQDPLFRGDVLQIIVGNSRRYARVGKITPDAHVDDGVLDLCIITTGTTLNTLQQLTSLLLRQKPARATAEYFRGAHLSLKVPATVPLQVDGSPVKLKDYLDASLYRKFLAAENKEQVMVTYQLDTITQTLNVAVPRTYNDELFVHSSDEADTPHKELVSSTSPAQEQEHEEESAVDEPEPATKAGEEAVKVHRLPDLFPAHRDKGSDMKVREIAAQEQTIAAESQPDLRPNKADESLSLFDDRHTNLKARENLSPDGRDVIVVGKVPDPEHAHTYIIAGNRHKKSTGEAVPVAVVVNKHTQVLNADGEDIVDVETALMGLAEGNIIRVEGKRNKYSVLRARRVVLA